MNKHHEPKKNMMQTGNVSRALGKAKAKGQSPAIARSKPLEEKQSEPDMSRHSNHR